MPTNFPSSIDTYTTKVDGVSDVLAADTNNLQDAVRAIQIKVGVNGSTDAGSIEARVTALASVISATPTNVLNAIAGAATGAVGTYAFAHGVTGSPGTTAAGSSLSTSNRVGSWGPSLSGTWRMMGYADVSDRTTLWLRIS